MCAGEGAAIELCSSSPLFILAKNMLGEMKPTRAALFFLLSLAASASAARTTVASSPNAAKKKPSLIVSTDADIDDLLAIAMIVHSPVYNLEAIIVNGNDWTNPIAGVPNILTILKVSERARMSRRRDKGWFPVGWSAPCLFL